MTPDETERDPAQGRPGARGQLSRRELLGGIGASVAAASTLLSGCARAPSEKIVPYRVQPEDVVPGRPAHYATAMTIDGYATGLLVEAHEGRPTKIEGNPEHPASLGKSGVYEQAAILGLYSPYRQREIRRRREASDSSSMLHALRLAGDANSRGRGLHLVLPPTSSSLTAQLLGRLRERLPELRLHFFSALGCARAFAGAGAAFGAPLEARPDLRRADLVLSLDADFCSQPPDCLRRASQFAERRRVLGLSDSMNRLYVVEPLLSITGQMADHRLALRDGDFPAFVAVLLLRVALELGDPPSALASVRERIERAAAHSPQHQAFIAALAKDLTRRRGAAVVLVGARQPPSVQAAAHALNHLLDPAGDVAAYGPSPILLAGSSEHDSLLELAHALSAGSVQSLVVLESNIAQAAPADLRLAEHLRQARSSFYLGVCADETAARSEWVIPGAHFLEAWDDARAVDGTASIVQPLLAPLYGGRTQAEILALLLGDAAPSAHELTRANFRRTFVDDDETWERSLARGTVAGSAFSPASPRLRWEFLGELLELATKPVAPLELSVTLDSRLLDGRFGDNAWLLELPDPVTKLSWGNAALLAPQTAQRLQLETGDVVALRANGKRVETPVVVVPGQANDCVGLSLGWGKRPFAPDASGANAFELVSSALPWNMPIALEALSRREELPLTQLGFSLQGFDESIVALTTLAALRHEPDLLASRRKRQLSLYASDAPKAPRQWGMSIDLNACSGCGACVIACQAENNVPTVGKSGVLKGRQMHWLRVDRYVREDARFVSQPMACQHCEMAPCEYVCPTGATVHSSDGLNQMVYNRCVGTRFCSNNCPYKVRRFNWFDYHGREALLKELVYNPNVSVRERGVMEKCTYCVQRIRGAESRAVREARPLVDGDVTPACEQACPSQAIVFGDVADPRSRVSVLQRSPRAFAVLNELGTAPRTRYLAKLHNPNPELG